MTTTGSDGNDTVRGGTGDDVAIVSDHNSATTPTGASSNDIQRRR